MPRWLRAELRSDHAGETGAVAIYHGILRFSTDAKVREFALEHLKTEEEHLALFEDWLAPSEKSVLLPAWRLSGWLLGALSVIGGSRGVYGTIEAVETFVVSHYRQQIDRLDAGGGDGDIRAALERCMMDEAHHRDDAADRWHGTTTIVERVWRWIVGSGSAMAVVVAKRL